MNCFDNTLNVGIQTEDFADCNTFENHIIIYGTENTRDSNNNILMRRKVGLHIPSQTEIHGMI